MKKINYFNSNFWNKDSKKINFVSKDGFDENLILNQLGLSESPLRETFGISDYLEIEKRTKIVEFLKNNPDLREYLSNLIPLFSLPHTETEFIKEYVLSEKKPFFFRKMEELKQILGSKDKVPKEFKELLDLLNSNLDLMYQKEDSMTRNLIMELDKSTFVEGEIKVHVSKKKEEKFTINLLRPEVFGYKDNYYGIGTNFLMDKLPSNANSFWRRITGIKKIMVWNLNKKNSKKRKLFYSNYILNECPKEIENDLKKFIKNNLPALQEIFKLEKIEGLGLNFFFNYSKGKLTIELIDAFSDGGERKFDSKISFSDQQKYFPGYSKETLEREMKMNLDFEKRLNLRKNSFTGLGVIEKIENLIPGFTSKQQIDSFETSKIFPCKGVVELYSHPLFKEDYSQISIFREFLADNCYTLNEVSILVDQALKNAKAIGLELESPIVLEPSKNVISFDSLMPVQLIGQKKSNGKNMKLKDLVPIKGLEDITGQSIGITGLNAGGKSVLLQTIIATLYLAQSIGLVFGKGFKYNPKKLLGVVSVANDPSKGSLLQTQARKLTAFFKELEAHDENSALILLDELLSGTSHLEIIANGMDLLEALSKRKTSCIFTTQEGELAKSAGENSNVSASLYQIKENYKLARGVGDPKASRVLEQEGLSKYLKK